MRTPEQQLVHMVNQIAENNQYHGLDTAVEKTTSHLQKFWARSMKKDIKKHLKNGGDGLSEISQKAINHLT